MQERPVPLAVRLFVYGFLGVFLVTGSVGIEAWPLTGWKLFSRVRTERQVGWEAVTVDAGGVERPVPFSELPRGYQGGAHLFSAWRRFPRQRVEASCRDLAGAVRQRQPNEVKSLRVYLRVRRFSSTGRDDIAVSDVGRTLLYECARSPQGTG